MAQIPITPSQTISPPIFYWGTPVVLITTENEDGTSNIAPMSSAWWLGNRCMLGLGAISQTTINLIRTKQCVLNLASDNMAGPVNALARTTGAKEVLTAAEGTGYLYFKRMNGYQYVPDKFGHAGLTPTPSDLIRPPRIAECPAQMEAELKGVDERLIALEVKVLRTHVHENIRMTGHANRIDPDKWNPLIMSFQELYGLQRKKTSESILAKINEEGYRPFSNPIEDEVSSLEEEETATE
ncbi:FMN-binding split barrel [Aspergillus arachidicola]|uniref:FMN-binding split barrel n=1 Tax=Aspergillus arachidicola TaxID=656916 RepID=A0A2G7FHD8_9EURO|nr:FMN-binding split barrel [Aspergillus arachidicola]